MPSLETIDVAYSFAETALSDSKSAGILYSRKQYPQACYLLQQSVEKSTKAFGLVMGTVKLEELRGPVGHHSMLAITQHFLEYFDKTRDILNVLLKSIDDISQKPRPESWIKRQELKNLLNPKLIQSLLRLDKFLSEIDINSISENARQEIHGKDKEMWKATLQLQTNEESVRVALKRLEEKKMEPGFLSLLTGTLNYLGGSNEYLQGLVCFVGFYRIGWRIGPLSFLTMWHENTTRYPKALPGDYGSPSDYVQNTPFVKKFVLLNEHAKTCAEESLRSIRLVKKGALVSLDRFISLGT